MTRLTARRQSLGGFTLLELMVVVAIIGILMSIAMPLYSSYVMQSRRSDGQTALMQLQLAQEKYRLNHTTYGATADLYGTGVASQPSSSGYYTVSVISNSVSGFTAQASPQGSQANDTACGASNFQITEKGPDLTGTNKTCWGQN